MCVFRPGPENIAFTQNYAISRDCAEICRFTGNSDYRGKLVPGGPREPMFSIRFFIYSGPGSGNAGFHIFL